ncbi:hypothetical protein HMPREF1154_0336, partial [Capnocytophaga sp. CM59]
MRAAQAIHLREKFETMTAREEIQELNDHLQAFPKAEDIFVKEQ